MVRWLCWLAVALLWGAAQAAQAEVLTGQWDWGAGGGIVEISADGTGHDSRGNTMQWTLQDPAAGVYVLVWSHGFTDTATVSSDGEAIDIVNNVGTRFTAMRRGLARSTAADLPGAWTWPMGIGTVDIFVDGTGRDGRGNTMKWTLKDAAARTYVLTWSHGYTDTATLSAEGNSLDIVNNAGAHFVATRGTGGAAGPLDLNGSWSNGLLHIWQDGSAVLLTAAWKRDDGKYVALRGEGTLTGRIVDLDIRYSPMTHGPVPLWHGTLTVSADGNVIDAVYTLEGVERDRRVYHRDR
jgi:hypothetical protein